MALFLYQIRQQVRYLLRDDTYPVEDVNAAINRVLMDINGMGRFKFHQSSSDLTMATSTYKYADPSGLLAEKVLVYRAFTTYETTLAKYEGVIDAFVNEKCLESGDTPETYFRWGGYFYIDPIPTASTNGYKITVYGLYDLVPYTSDQSTSALPDRWARTTLAYGAAYQLNPNLRVGGTEGLKLIGALYEMSLKNMINQEHWDPMVVPAAIRSKRWADSDSWGHVNYVRS